MPIPDYKPNTTNPKPSGPLGKPEQTGPARPNEGPRQPYISPAPPMKPKTTG